MRSKLLTVWCGLLPLTLVNCKTVKKPKSSQSGVMFPYESGRWPSKSIKVCFESSGDLLPSYQQAVREVVEREYNGRAGMAFHGFVTCSQNEDVRIKLSQRGEASKVTEFGAYLKNRPDGLLLFTSTGPNPEPMNTFKAIALHEFGHVLGLLHEHVHSDSNCKKYEAAASHTKIDITPYDPDSLMNYCSFIERYHTKNPPEPTLNDADIAAVKAIFDFKFDPAAKDLGALCTGNGGNFDTDDLCCRFPVGKESVKGAYDICNADDVDRQAACSSLNGTWDVLSKCCWSDQMPDLSKLKLSYCANVYKDPIAYCKADGGTFDKTEHCCAGPKNPTSRSVVNAKPQEAPKASTAVSYGYSICGSLQNGF